MGRSCGLVSVPFNFRAGPPTLSPTPMRKSTPAFKEAYFTSYLRLQIQYQIYSPRIYSLTWAHILLREVGVSMGQLRQILRQFYTQTSQFKPPTWNSMGKETPQPKSYPQVFKWVRVGSGNSGKIGHELVISHDPSYNKLDHKSFS